jgi:riboflavin synthase
VFTGLIGDLGEVRAFELDEAGARVRIASALARELVEGDSIALDGVCLTATSVDGDEFGAEIMAESLERSSLRALAEGSRVNLELPLRVSGRLGGHLVQGHVDATATVSDVREEGFARVLSLELDAPLARYLVEKGSVALNGVSLTVSALGEHGFSVSLIPETLKRTNLGELAEGALVNLEVDILAKQLERLMDARALPLGGVVEP